MNKLQKKNSSRYLFNFENKMTKRQFYNVLNKTPNNDTNIEYQYKTQFAELSGVICMLSTYFHAFLYVLIDFITILYYFL